MARYQNPVEFVQGVMGVRSNPTREVDGLLVRSDGRRKNFKYGSEVPDRVLKGQFDYLTDGEDSDGFFRYQGTWYHLSEFERSPESLRKAGWEGYAPNSFSTGVVLSVSRDGEQYKVGSYRTKPGG